MRTALDIASVVMVGACGAGAGWWARATVDEWRMRRLLVRINSTIAERR